MMPAMKIIERMIIRSQLIGMLISGCLFVFVVCFAFLFMMIIRMPVRPPEMTPPMPRIEEKLRRLNCVIRMYMASGTREVNRMLVFVVVLRSNLNVSRREKLRTK